MMIIERPDVTWLKLSAEANCQEFMREYIKLLKTRPLVLKVMDSNSNFSHSYYTCGQEHDRRNPAWRLFQHLMRHCQELEYGFYEARDMIEERFKRKLICECELLKN